MTGQTRLALQSGVATVAAAFALHNVFAGWGWLLPVAGAVAVVAVVSEMVRRSPVPSGARSDPGRRRCARLPDGALRGRRRRTGTSSRPEPHSTGWTRSPRPGSTTSGHCGPPVPTHDGLVLIATVGVAAIALVVDLFAVTMRRAAVAGLPLLALFAVGTSVAKHGAGWLAFVIGATGYLWLLLADARDRLARWGRPQGHARGRPAAVQLVDQRGRAVTAVGARPPDRARRRSPSPSSCPLMIPGLRGGVPHGGGGGFGFGDGSRAAVTVNPIVSIQAQLNSPEARPVLSVRTTADSPGYLRMTALDRFEGSTFQPSTLQAPAEAAVSEGIGAATLPGGASRVDAGPGRGSGCPMAAAADAGRLGLGGRRLALRPRQQHRVLGADGHPRPELLGRRACPPSRPRPSCAQSPAVTVPDDETVATALHVPDSVPAGRARWPRTSPATRRRRTTRRWRSSVSHLVERPSYDVTVQPAASAERARRRSCSRPGGGSASSTPRPWPSSPASKASRPGSRSASPPGSTRPTAPTWSPPTTRTPGRSSTSAASAGCAFEPTPRARRPGGHARLHDPGHGPDRARHGSGRERRHRRRCNGGPTASSPGRARTHRLDAQLDAHGPAAGTADTPVASAGCRRRSSVGWVVAGIAPRPAVRAGGRPVLDPAPPVAGRGDPGRRGDRRVGGAAGKRDRRPRRLARRAVPPGQRPAAPGRGGRAGDRRDQARSTGWSQAVQRAWYAPSGSLPAGTDLARRRRPDPHRAAHRVGG